MSTLRLTEPLSVCDTFVTREVGVTSNLEDVASTFAVINGRDARTLRRAVEITKTPAYRRRLRERAEELDRCTYDCLRARLERYGPVRYDSRDDLVTILARHEVAHEVTAERYGGRVAPDPADVAAAIAAQMTLPDRRAFSASDTWRTVLSWTLGVAWPELDIDAVLQHLAEQIS